MNWPDTTVRWSRRNELYEHAADMVARDRRCGRSGPQRRADQAEVEADQTALAAGQFPVGGMQRPFHFRHHRLGPRTGRPGRKFRCCENIVHFGVGEENEVDASARHDGGGADQCGDGQRSRRIAPPDRQADKRQEQPFPEPFECTVKPAFERRDDVAADENCGDQGPNPRKADTQQRRERTGRFAPPAAGPEGVAHMAGKHEETLDQTGQNHSNHDQRNCADDRSDNVGNQQEGQERRNRRQRCAENRCRHAACAGFCCQRIVVALPMQRFGMLAHHDGVVHDDADRHDQGEQADHVDRLVGQPHRHHRRRQRNRYADGNPKRHPPVQKQEQDDQHDNQTRRAVRQEQTDAAADQVGLDIVTLKFQVGRQSRLDFLNIFFDLVGKNQRVVRRRALGVQLDRPVLPAPVGQAVAVEKLRAPLRYRAAGFSRRSPAI